MRAAIFLVSVLMTGSAFAADGSAADCATAETPTAQLICRDAALAAAGEKLDTTVKAFGDATGEVGRKALAAGQHAWVQRRDAACPVTSADLADSKKSKERAGCLLRLTAERTKALEDNLSARRAPVADQPLTITDAVPPRLPAASAKPSLPKRPAGVAGVAGRWAKADPQTRTPIDDCRTSYLEVSKEAAISLNDPRIPSLPIQGRLTLADGDPAQGLTFGADGTGPKGELRLDAAEAPRLDRLFLRLKQPLSFGATFVRCR
ncbi:lysozyme inhibitor LprI family protein [Azospirillum soli]|uniref:lysozyme inhibitor LprI family protein n=1 Tax=Azospirillum soli TaxID=1304799 RepID=UPI001AE61331|nr:lysozyme inhibitor LprI family protein [Azospirillum soli]MBP2314444.1 uncharacterized protein YecT (DUF1311 family) [Azospirillum soli]